MNQQTDKPLKSQCTAKREQLTRKLLAAARRARRLPTVSLLCEATETMPPKLAKVLGPYQEGGKWRLVVKDGETRKSLWFTSELEAVKVRTSLLSALEDRGSRTIGEAVSLFLTMKTKQGLKERSIICIRERLIRFLPANEPLNAITDQRAQTLYDELAERSAAATHHAALRRAKEFFAWCIKERLVSMNPFANIKPVGRPKTGKPQLRQDEAKKLSDLLIERSSQGDASALALLVQVLLGLRSSEVLRLRKRDLDRNGSVFVVEGTKNRNAKRTLGIDSPIVRQLLARHVVNLAPEALIFAPSTRQNAFATDHLYKKLKTYCKLAGVPVVCPHSLRGLHSSLAVQVGATSAHVAQALGHSSFAITRKHYIAPGALEASRTSLISDALLGDSKLDALITALRELSAAQLDHVASEVGLVRR